jgi:hypothetical protein
MLNLVNDIAVDGLASCVLVTSTSHSMLGGANDVGASESQVYALDVASGAFSRVSVDSSGKAKSTSASAAAGTGWPNGSGPSLRVATGDCKTIGFLSTGALEGAQAGTQSAYVRDTASGKTKLVSFGDKSSHGMALSPTGSAVFRDVKEGRAGGPPWTNPAELWLWDAASGARTWISWAPKGGGAAVVAAPARPYLSSDDKWLTAQLQSAALCAGASTCLARKDLANGKWDYAAVRPDGKPATPLGPLVFVASADGSSIAFTSADDLVDDGKDTQGAAVLYHRSFVTNQLRALTLDAKGVPAGGVKGFDVSGDGRFVVFVADDELLGGTGQSGLFRYDAVADQVVALNVDASGKPLSSQDVVPAYPVFSTPRISADGKRVVVRAPESPGSHHGLVKSPSDDKDTGLFLWQE